MNIYSNSQFPRKRSELVSSAPTTRRERFDTLSYVAELEARNAKALQELSKKRSTDVAHTQQTAGRRKKKGDNRRFSGHTGPPIETPGGHVHAIEGWPRNV